MQVGVVAAAVLTARSSTASTEGTVGKTSGAHRRQPDMRTNHWLSSQTCRPGDSAVDVALWRRCRLLDSGFPEPLATRLANTRVDLHALLQLVDRGCPPELAARILEPIELTRSGSSR
jgi:hypothetical protein